VSVIKNRHVESPTIQNSVAVFLIILSVSIAFVYLRVHGGLEKFELAAYDWSMALRTAITTKPRVVLIGITEKEISDIGTWPLTDFMLAEALKKLIEYQPVAIGLDIYRNLPVPPGSAELELTIREEPMIVMIRKFSDVSSPGVPPPTYLNDDADRVGFSDLVIDPDGVMRRGLLYLDDEKTFYQSLALRLSTIYLATKAISPRPDPLNPEFIRLGSTTITPLCSNDGGYADIDAAGYQYLLDFRDDSKSLPVFTFSELQAGRIPKNELLGKIVILGTMAASLHDSYFTPVQSIDEQDGMVPGMTLHGHAASQILRFALDDHQPIESLSEVQEMGLIFFGCIVGGFISLRIRSLIVWSLVLTAGLFFVTASGVLAINFGCWIPVVPTGLGMMVSAVVANAYCSHEESKNRAYLMDLFSRHVSVEVANSLWLQRQEFMNSGRPLPKSLTATVLFTDIVGFTSISEELAPADLMEWLNRYMEVMGLEIMSHGGIINKYIGDSIMAIFGIPVARINETEIRQDAVNAVRCAMAMRTALRELNREWMSQGKTVVGTRIGIFTGSLIAGSLGSATRMEYTVLGDTVNIASRLESYEKHSFLFHPIDNPCRIILGSSTNDYLNNAFATRLVGDIQLKGKLKPVSIYELIRENPEQSFDD